MGPYVTAMSLTRQQKADKARGVAMCCERTARWLTVAADALEADDGVGVDYANYRIKWALMHLEGWDRIVKELTDETAD